MYIKANPNFLMREVAGEYILISLGNEEFVTDDLIIFNETSAFIWNHIQDEIELEELISMAENEYDNDDHSIRNDISDFVTGMIQLGFIKRRDN